MSDCDRDLAEGYAAALQLYLSDPDEVALARAYGIGRKALGDGLGVLELATVHSRALRDALEKPLSHSERLRILDGLEKFFVEVLSPYEMAQRGFREANAVLRQLNDVLEGQAKRIAYALHNEAGQLLASAHLALAGLAAVRAPETADEVRAIRGLLNQVEERLRHISHELRPQILDDLGLVPALEFLADSASKRWGLAVTVEARTAQSLPAIVETTLYRVAQEALTNIARHAKATRARIFVRWADHRISCSVLDDGIGLDASAVARKGTQGLGLVEIRERIAAFGGTFRIGPGRENGGTELTVEIPLED